MQGFSNVRLSGGSVGVPQKSLCATKTHTHLPSSVCAVRSFLNAQFSSCTTMAAAHDKSWIGCARCTCGPPPWHNWSIGSISWAEVRKEARPFQHGLTYEKTSLQRLKVAAPHMHATQGPPRTWSHHAGPLVKRAAVSTALPRPTKDMVPPCGAPRPACSGVNRSLCIAPLPKDPFVQACSSAGPSPHWCAHAHSPALQVVKEIMAMSFNGREASLKRLSYEPGLWFALKDTMPELWLKEPKTPDIIVLKNGRKTNKRKTEGEARISSICMRPTCTAPQRLVLTLPTAAYSGHPQYM